MITSRPFAILFSAVLIGALIWPIRENWRKKPKDNFPLSYYPMFSHKRDNTYTMRYFVGYDSTRNRYCIPYKYLGTGGFNQVRRQVRKKIKSGDREELTRQVAVRLAQSNRKDFKRLVSVACVKGTYHLEDYFLANEKLPLSETVLSRQNIVRDE